VDDEPRPDPAALARRAPELRAELPGRGLSPEPQRFVDAHLVALECSGRKLSGADIPFVEEVEAYFQVHVSLGDQDAYREAHAALDRLLPGEAALPERLQAFRARDEVPPDRLESCVYALSSTLRDHVRTQYGLPPEEIVEYQVVTDK